jgi:hypothetical protein
VTEYGERADMKRFLADYRVEEVVVVEDDEDKPKG